MAARLAGRSVGVRRTGHRRRSHVHHRRYHNHQTNSNAVTYVLQQTCH